MGHGPASEEHSHDEHEEGGHEEPWLVAYADLMTLLFGFFAMLFTFATFSDENDEFVKVRKEIAKYFGMTHVSPADAMNRKIEEALRATPNLGQTNIKVTDYAVEVSMTSQSLFDSGSSEIKPGSRESLVGLAKALVADQAVNPFELRVEGHCDDNPVRGGKFGSNWELSAARASEIVRVLETEGVPAGRLGAMGYGDSRPAYPNRDTAGRPIPMNQELNRRVVMHITLLATEAPKAPARETASEQSALSKP